jgi:hypothetical protein
VKSRDVDDNGDANSAPADFTMTELEERLRSLTGAEVAKQLLESFDARAQGISLAITKGLSPEDFERAQAISNAIASARDRDRIT